MSNEVQVYEATEIAPANLYGTSDPKKVVLAATERANALHGIIEEKKLYKQIGPKKHVYVEGWTLLGSMMGVFPVCTWTKPILEGERSVGWEARVEARTLTGAIVGAAEAQCLRAESNWKSRDDFALRSMAQTRATSKALRLPLGYIVTLAGYDATPMEEMAPEPRSPGQGAVEAEASVLTGTPPPSSPEPCRCGEKMLAKATSDGRKYLVCEYSNKIYKDAKDDSQKAVAKEIQKKHDFRWVD